MLTLAGSTPNSSATTIAATVSGLLPHMAWECSSTWNSPVGSIVSVALSGLEVIGNAGSSNQNQNSVEREDAALLGGGEADADVAVLLLAQPLLLRAPVGEVDHPSALSSTAW